MSQFSKKITVSNVYNCVETGENDDAKLQQYEMEGGDDMDASDGYHTFEELYEHRITLFIALCKQINNQPYGDSRKHMVWRSKLHSDGTSWDGWFIMGIGKDEGEQITYHLPIKEWQNTEFAETLEQAPKFDGHESWDVLERLTYL